MENGKTFNIEGICDFIIKTVQTKSILSGFQYIVDFDSINDEFGMPMNFKLKLDAYDALLEREEVADVELTDEGFDVVLYTKYAPNYNEEDYI